MRLPSACASGATAAATSPLSSAGRTASRRRYPSKPTCVSHSARSPGRTSWCASCCWNRSIARPRSCRGTRIIESRPDGTPDFFDAICANLTQFYGTSEPQYFLQTSCPILPHVRSFSLSFNEFMQRPAIELRTGGRYSLASRRDLQGNRREFACRTTRISPFQMLVAAPVLGPRGERVISHFGELGRLDGWITDTIEGGFLVDIAVTRKERE